MGNGSDEMQFRELLGKLEALWTTEKFCEKQDDVWRLLKRDVPRRSRFTCDTVHDLLDILTDREVITPQETVLLKRLAAVFSVQEASEHIQAFRKIPLDQDTCSLCSAPCQAPLLYRTPVQEITGQKELVCAILYLCQENCTWKTVVRAFPKTINVKEAEIERLESMVCASKPQVKRCLTCSGFEVMESWRKKHPQHATVQLLLKYLTSERVSPRYAEDIKSDFHMTMTVRSKCLLCKTGCELQAQRGETVSVQIVCAQILNRDIRERS
ncbi:uncharacterized protein LOC119161075 isoform X1 [Rhipicephalus microplus]|uniref:uncharacterized protein LOC119161075 isoform X1 n=2 Tax=Rhipicephalus microplus TaxID=6941 RepID=UPI003F6B673A